MQAFRSAVPLELSCWWLPVDFQTGVSFPVVASGIKGLESILFCIHVEAFTAVGFAGKVFPVLYS